MTPIAEIGGDGIVAIVVIVALGYVSYKLRHHHHPDHQHLLRRRHRG